MLHDVFAVPFDEIAPIIDRSPDAARQLASRRPAPCARRAGPDAALEAQREVVDAFLAAAREGDFERLVSVLDPEVVLHADFGHPLRGRLELHGVEAVTSQARTYSRLGLVIRPAVVNGAAGIVTFRDGEPFSVGAFTVRGGRIVEIDFLGRSRAATAAGPDRPRLDEDFGDDFTPSPIPSSLVALRSGS